MYLSKIVLFLLSTTFITLYVKAQGSLATIVLGVVDDSGDSENPGEFQGQDIGTGPDGTTFIIEALPTDSTDGTLTATVVQDATHVSVHMAGASDSLSVEDDVVCDLNPEDASSNITCTEIVTGLDGSQTFGVISLETGPATLTVIEVSSSTPGPNPMPTISTGTDNGAQEQGSGGGTLLMSINNVALFSFISLVVSLIVA